MRYGIYVRLSKTDDDRAVSLDQQREACRRYVAEQGGTIVLESRDVQSGLDPERPGYQTILQAGRDERIDAAVVWRWDRFGREPAEALSALKELSDLGIEVQSATESSEDPFVRGLMLLLANKESRTISARVKPVMTMQAKSGRWQGRPPTGYDLVGRLRDGKLRDSKLVPNSKAPLIRALFDRAVDGESIASLRRWAHSVGLSSPTGNPPSRSIIHKWLKNPAYCGTVTYNRESKSRFEQHHKRPESEWVVAPNSHPAIITTETFAAVQAILASHQQFQATVRGSRWLLTGIVRCAYCGSRMYGRKGGKNSYTYYCYKGVDFGGCQQRFTGGATLDAWVKAEIEDFQITPEIRKRAAAIIKAEAEQGITEWQQRRENLTSAHERHQETRQKLARRLFADTIPKDIYRKMEEDEATAIHAIEQELAKQEAPPPAPDLTPIMDVLETLSWSTLDDEAWREVVALLVARIDVSGLNDYRLTWTDVGLSLGRVLERV